MNTSDVPAENKEELSDFSSVSPLSDFVFSLFWIALGCLIMLASWQMDRLEGWSFSCICPNLLRRFGGAQLDALLVGNFFICNHLYFFI